ncbi:MAG: lytic transglycosylase domain-containing protein [Armatimonadetes bacterium]|nr:lytic transglycosylase domain-containing protein [Armatimonadota bacterium]
MKQAYLCAFLTLFLAGTALGSPYPQAERYFALRAKHLVVSDATPENIQTQPTDFDGRLVEVRGQVVGSALRDGGGSFILNGDQHVWMVDATDLPLLDLLKLRTAVRLLCRVGTVQGTGTGMLMAAAGVLENDAGAWEEMKARQAEEVREAARLRAEAQRQRQPVRASRGAMQTQVPIDVSPSYEQILQAYSKAVRFFNRRLNQAQADRIARNIINYSVKYGLDARLVMAVIACESNFNLHAISRAGAMGLGQLMPGTAAGLGVTDPFNAEQNLEGATRLLSGHIRTFARKRGGEVTEREIRLALACYNAGAGAVNRHKGIPPYRETRNYIRKVTELYRRFCGEE